VTTYSANLSPNSSLHGGSPGHFTLFPRAWYAPFPQELVQQTQCKSMRKCTVWQWLIKNML